MRERGASASEDSPRWGESSVLARNKIGELDSLIKLMKKLHKYIDSNSKEVINFTRRLVEIQTVNPPGRDYDKAVALIEAQCRRFGFSIKKIETPKSIIDGKGVKGGSRRITLIARWNLKRPKTVHLNGHYDVVPATGGWKTDPFKAVIKNGRIYGRGTEDMKGTLAAMLYAAGAIKKYGLKPDVNVELSFVPDEETGGATGAAYSLKKIQRPDFVIGEGYSKDYISNGNKGVLWADVEVSGLPAHASEPHKGINAFEKMVFVAVELMKLKKKIGHRQTRYSVKDKKDRFATFVMGGELSGREKVNIVPDKASFSIDRRILPEESVKDAKREIVMAIEKMKRRDRDLNVKVIFRSEEPPIVSDKSGILSHAMRRAIHEVRGGSTGAALLPGCTDIRFLARRGSQSAGYSVAGAGRHHGDDEFIYVKNLIDTTKIFAGAIMGLK